MALWGLPQSSRFRARLGRILPVGRKAPFLIFKADLLALGKPPGALHLLPQPLALSEAVGPDVFDRLHLFLDADGRARGGQRNLAGRDLFKKHPGPTGSRKIPPFSDL